MSYSTDLRCQVVSFVARGMKKSEVSRLFKISRPTINAWLKLKETKGTLKKKELSRVWRKLSEEEVLKHVKLYPDMELSERAKHFKVSITGIWRAMKKLKITRKKRLFFTKKEMKSSASYFWSK